ncbi:class I SAM-dependent methyltransferase [Halovivax gelatinilyticus]|uniref:class I SAM-dependent methyltransferase n=1 Tax=Halovivax gelatinilyticus TaxID=2961597 RepID=UPI0020CA8B56|nr:methyltransferase domain-containing protein [Halovivax gelatinilyticus]
MGFHWDDLYREDDYERRIYLGDESMADYLETFLARFGPVDDVVSVGCGPGVVPFELAERYPDLPITGLDYAETIVADNRTLAAERGLENLSFAVDALPDLATDRRFDLVYCVATLFFVADAARAIESLYDLVRPGGYLVVNYPNEHTQEWAREADPEKRADFSLVAAGENTLSREEIESILNTDSHDYWEAVDADDEEFVSPDLPMVYVRR